MATFTNEEYADMLMAYGKADGNGREAKRIYEERFPNRRQPSRDTFATTFRRLRETGNLNRREPGVGRQRNVADDERILEAFEEDPTTSIRTLAATLNLRAWKVWSVLRDNGKHPIQNSPVQDCLFDSLIEDTKKEEKEKAKNGSHPPTTVLSSDEDEPAPPPPDTPPKKKPGPKRKLMNEEKPKPKKRTAKDMLSDDDDDSIFDTKKEAKKKAAPKKKAKKKADSDSDQSDPGSPVPPRKPANARARPQQKYNFSDDSDSD